MSYLTIPKGIPNFSKAVISLWFRVPKDSVEARLAAYVPASGLTFTIPLIVAGKAFKQQNWRLLYGDVSDKPGQDPVTGQITSYFAFYGWEAVGAPYDVGPSWIGIVPYSVNPNSDHFGTFDLEFNLQFDTYGEYAALGWVVEPPAVTSPDGLSWTITPKDITPTLYDFGPPEHFYVLTGEGPTGPDDKTSLRLKPDEWHHLLLSFDLTGGMSIGGVGHPFPKSGCRMWYAIDDKDYRGPKNFQPYRDKPFEDVRNEGDHPGYHPAGDDLDPNAVVTENIYDNSGDAGGDNTFLGIPVPAPSGTYTPTPLPLKEQPFGIPGTPTYVNDIYRVEMAEFQLFTGVTLDTGIEKNRRAFVDKDGKPVPPDQKKKLDDPQSTSGSIELLGKLPEVLLHGSSKWQDGKNTGTLGVEINSEGEETDIPSGQFTPTAKIEPYKPEPALTETPTA